MQNLLMMGGIAVTQRSYDEQRITDLTLAVLQDSGWYDVKYGSQGWSAHPSLLVVPATVHALAAATVVS